MRAWPWGACAAVLVLWACFRAFTVDDAFITFRYALNCAAGHGLVMNPGERVEGTSSLPWALVLALPTRFGIGPEHAAPTLAVLAALALVVVAHRVARTLAGEVAARAAAWFAALVAPLAIWSASGMETVAYAALLGLWLWILVRPQEAPGFAGGAGAGLAAAFRPEGLALVLAPAIARALQPPGIGALLRAAAGAALILVPVAGFRLAYFGDIVANSVHAKSPGLAALAPGVLYAAKILVSYALVVRFASAGVQHVPRSGGRILAVALGVQLLFTIAVGGDHFAGARFLVPVLVPLAALAGVGVACTPWRTRHAPAIVCAVAGLGLLLGAEALLPVVAPLLALARLHLPAAAHAGRIAEEIRHAGVVVLGLAAWLEFGARAQARGRLPGLVLALAAALVPQAWDPQIRACRQADGASTYGRAVGAWLRGAVPPATVVATNAAGALPYVSGLPVIDMLGLCDRTIARSRPDVRQWVGHERGDGASVLERRPDLIVLGGAEGALEPWPFPGDQQLFAAAAFHAEYVPMRARVRDPKGDFDFQFYCRRDRYALLRQSGAVDAGTPAP